MHSHVSCAWLLINGVLDCNVFQMIFPAFSHFLDNTTMEHSISTAVNEMGCRHETPLEVPVPGSQLPAQVCGYITTGYLLTDLLSKTHINIALFLFSNKMNGDFPEPANNKELNGLLASRPFPNIVCLITVIWYLCRIIAILKSAWQLLMV